VVVVEGEGFIESNFSLMVRVEVSPRALRHPSESALGVMQKHDEKCPAEGSVLPDPVVAI
jgi:hypothetical protein